MGQAPQTDARAFIWDAGRVTPLPPIPDGFTSNGEAINSLADVAGLGLLIDGETGNAVARAFAWIDDKMFLIDPLPGFLQSRAFDLNDAQHVVGTASTLGLRGFVWRHAVLADLNDLISPDLNLTIKVVRGINRAGQITADADSDDLNATVGLVLTPVQGPPGDLDGDCVVGILDLLALLAGWGAVSADGGLSWRPQ